MIENTDFLKTPKIDIGKIEFARDIGKEKYGITKTPERTKQYTFQTLETFRAGRFKILDKAITGNEKLKIKSVLREARDEMCRFQYPDSDHDNVRYTKSRRGPSGKVGGRNDDMCIAIQMLIYYSITKKIEHEIVDDYVRNHQRTVT